MDVIEIPTWLALVIIFTLTVSVTLAVGLVAIQLTAEPVYTDYTPCITAEQYDNLIARVKAIAPKEQGQ